MEAVSPDATLERSMVIATNAAVGDTWPQNVRRKAKEMVENRRENEKVAEKVSEKVRQVGQTERRRARARAIKEHAGGADESVTRRRSVLWRMWTS